MKYANDKMELKDAGSKGLGVFAREQIQKGEIFHIPDGVERNASEIEKLNPQDFDFVFEIGDGMWLSPADFNSPSPQWFMNHSCDPNTVSLSNNYECMAARDIAPGEEITIDYATFDDDSDYVLECRCGSFNCRGTIYGNDWKKSELQKKYRGHFQKNIQEKIDALTRRKDN